MIDRIAALWQGLSSSGEDAPPSPPEDPKLAAAVLMVEVARMDESIDAEERDRIVQLVAWKFNLNEAEATSLVAEAEKVTRGPAHWHRFAAPLRDQLSESERIQIIDLLWDVVYADGKLHHLEMSLMRRVTSLLNISDADSGSARQRARKRHGLPEDHGVPAPEPEA